MLYILTNAYHSILLHLLFLSVWIEKNDNLIVIKVLNSFSQYLDSQNCSKLNFQDDWPQRITSENDVENERNVVGTQDDILEQLKEATRRYPWSRHFSDCP